MDFDKALSLIMSIFGCALIAAGLIVGIVLSSTPFQNNFFILGIEYLLGSITVGIFTGLLMIGIGRLIGRHAETNEILLELGQDILDDLRNKDE